MSIIESNKTMLDEIAEESELFSYVLERKNYYTKDFVNIFLNNKIKKIYFLGSGSPSHLSTTLKYAAIKILKVEASCSLPSLFNNHEGFNISNAYRPNEMLLICPVESGRTKGPVIAARKAKELGVHVVCTTLNENGILTKAADVVIKKPFSGSIT